MDILEIPFHKYMNIKKVIRDKDLIFRIEERPEYLNHLGTIHACVQLSLAEATSGEFLLHNFRCQESGLIPVIRKTEAKYHRPANGELFSKAEFFSPTRLEALVELNEKNRTLIKVKVEVNDSEKNKVLTVIFDWFIIRK
jgi:hypothetical protein